MGGKRSRTMLALRQLHDSAAQPPEILPLPAGAPFGAVQVDTGRLHHVPVLRRRLPDRRACSTTRTAPGWASTRRPAFNAACAGRPVRRA